MELIAVQSMKMMKIYCICFSNSVTKKMKSKFWSWECWWFRKVSTNKKSTEQVGSLSIFVQNCKRKFIKKIPKNAIINFQFRKFQKWRENLKKDGNKSKKTKLKRELHQDMKAIATFWSKSIINTIRTSCNLKQIISYNSSPKRKSTNLKRRKLKKIEKRPNPRKEF